MAESVLELSGVETCYGLSQVLFGVSLSIAQGEMVTLMGRNGMGKTTTVRSFMGLTPARAGAIRFGGAEIRTLPAYRIAQRGLLAERHLDVTRVGLAAIALHRLGIERQPRDHGDAVVALLAVQRDVLIAEPLEALPREGVVDALYFLQAEHVGAD